MGLLDFVLKPLPSPPGMSFCLEAWGSIAGEFGRDLDEPTSPDKSCATFALNGIWRHRVCLEERIWDPLDDIAWFSMQLPGTSRRWIFLRWWLHTSHDLSHAMQGVFFLNGTRPCK